MPGTSLRDAVMFMRLTRDLPRFLRARLAEQAALEALKRRLDTRESRFLELVRRSVYGNARSPYLPLLRRAGCELGDLEASVRREGLEATLTRLAEEGVYVSSDEFKGRAEVVRGSTVVALSEADFDNPLISPHFEIRSGGTRSPGTTIRVGLPFVADLAVNTAVGLNALGLSEHRHAYWLLSTALTLSLRVAKLGRPPVAWFYPLRPSAQLALAGRYLAALGRLSGSPIPPPTFLDLQQPERMAAWLHSEVQRGGPICLTVYGSSAVRVASAAVETGLPLEGVCFIVFGEPFTAAKARAIEAAGADAITHYGFSEGGVLGYSCGNPAAPDDVHVFRDAYAIVQRPKAVGSGASVNAFLVTSLLSTTPKVFLNTELGDDGVMERRSCGCALESLGLREHLSRIRSHEKLSGEGMTFPAEALLGLLEDVLPRRFGGRPGDYQLVEREDERGVQRLRLLISPDVGPLDASEPRRAILEELGREGGYPAVGAQVWSRAETIEVVREQPLVTAAGKVLPFHTD